MITQEVFPMMIPIAFSIASSVITWIIADAAAKGRSSVIDEKLGESLKLHASEINRMKEKSGYMEIKLAKSEQDREELHRQIDKMDLSKASREVVDGIRTDITNLRLDMDKRFDKIERLLENSITKGEFQ